MARKPKIAIVSLTDCEGCEFAILDQGEKFFELTSRVDVAEFHLIEEEPERARYDIVFVEGPPVTKENFEYLKKLRQKSRILVALGNCAAEGGVYKIKNYHRDICQPRFVYPDTRRINDPKIQPIADFVRVDFTIPGCPLDGKEFIKYTYELIKNKIPKIPQRPVCYECQINKYPCLLQMGQPCLGPIILGGCNAVCPGAGMICEGCRGPLGEIDPDFKKALRKIIPQKRIEELFEIYGIKEKVKDKVL
jgi:sulfhydrogenase subunit delta